MSLGPVMVDLRGPELLPEEREMLRHPRVGGVILFSRNYQSPEQVAQLTRAVHALRHPHLLVAVDQEGGRVQRFREGFTALPPAAVYGAVYDQDPQQGKRLAELGGWLMAAELRAVGVDLSFAPVLDLEYGASTVIGDRAFHSHPEAVARLAQAFIQGMHRAGMPATGKHFPGHGAVTADSHAALPVDDRPLAAIDELDLTPYKHLIGWGLAGVMAAHVVYSRVDRNPAGFSPVWLRDILRGRLGFQGVIFSDDLSMAGAEFAGEPPERARMALAAGCDMVLVCNRPEAAQRVLSSLKGYDEPLSHVRLAQMHGRRVPGGHLSDLRHLHHDPQWRLAVDTLHSQTDAAGFGLTA